MIRDQIIYEDNHLIAVNKKPSQIVQADKTEDISLDRQIRDYLKNKYKKNGEVYLGLIHRLDRPVSGVIVYARTSKALSRMNAMFRENAVKKIYWAIVKNIPDPLEGELQHYLKKNEQQNKSYAYDKRITGSKPSRMKYRLVSKADRYSLLEVELETGRHHQIRCQLAKIGCPVKGDLKYGFPRSNPDGSISLHAVRLIFLHPVKKEQIEIHALPPEDKLWNALIRAI